MLQTAKDDIRRRFRHLLLEGHVEGIAERFVDAMSAATERILESPGIGAPRRSLNKKLDGLRSFPVEGFENVRIYYVVEKKKLKVVRVLHGRQDVRTLMRKSTSN